MNNDFSRSARLTVRSEDGDVQLETVDGQRLQFEASKSVKGVCGQLTVRVYGLTREDAEAALTRGGTLELSAGTGDRIGPIFRGDLIEGFSANGDTPYLQLTAMDGDAFYGSYISQSVGAGSTLANIAAVCAEKCSSPITVGRISPAALQTRLPRGAALFGRTADIMDALARQLNGVWFINDGRLYLLTEADMAFGAALTVDAETDLIGVPVVDAWSVSFNCHIDSRIILGAAITFSGFAPAGGSFRVAAVTTVGDTHDNDWMMSVYALRQDAGSPSMTAKTRNVWR